MQVGLATISAGVQRAGGSKKHPGPALDEALELRAASIEGGASGEAIGMGELTNPLYMLPYSTSTLPYSRVTMAAVILCCSQHWGSMVMPLPS